MTKTRVPKGEKYFYVNEVCHISEWEDTGGRFATMHFLSGNYFHTKEEAEAMARKLRAVLKGADVIEMPSEEEIESKATEIQMAAIEDKRLHKYELPYDMCAKVGAEIMSGYWKSKIVK